MTKVVKFTEQIVGAYLAGQSVADLEIEYNVGAHAIYNCLCRANVSRRSTRKLEGKEQEVSAAYLSGVSSAKLAEQYGTSVPTILAILRRIGAVVRLVGESNRKHFYNNNFFDIIDTEEKAYILGIFVADGYNNEKDGVIKLTLIDKDLVKIVGLNIGTDQPLYEKVSKKGKTAYELALNCKHMSQTLSKQGCPQKKTFITKFPDVSIVPPHLIHHYIRGYFDGDGCVHIRKKGWNKVVHIIGTCEFMTVMAQHLPCPSFVRKRHKNKVWFLGIYRMNHVEEFRDWLYRNATLFLARKKERFDRTRFDQLCVAA